MNKTYHRPIALRIELIIVVNLYISDAPGASLAGLRLHVLLEGVAPIGEESLAVLELDLEGLIVEAEPIAWDSLAIAAILTLTELGTSSQVLIQLHLPHLIISKTKLIVLSQYLHFVGQLMGADFFLLVQINFLGVLTHMEVPCADGVAEAAHGLVGFY